MEETAFALIFFSLSVAPYCGSVAVPGSTVADAATWLAKQIFHMKN
jgi:hypothetical protein